jgi:hypothetical protein
MIIIITIMIIIMIIEIIFSFKDYYYAIIFSFFIFTLIDIIMLRMSKSYFAVSLFKGMCIGVTMENTWHYFQRFAFFLHVVTQK